MSDVAVTKLKGQNFQILSCEKLTNPQSNGLSVNNSAMEKLLNSLRQNYDVSFIDNIKLKITDFLIQLSKQEDQITFLDIKEYKVCFHKVGKMVFGFLLHPLSDSDMSKIEKNSVGKSYFTGDFSDIFKTEKDFKH